MSPRSATSSGMLTLLPNDKLEVSVRPPLVYLDHWAIREISSAATRRGHFLETFRTRGTLMFSLVNVLEMARNTGESYTRIRDLLDAVEPCWLLSDPDPRTVQEREKRGLIAPASFLVPLNILGAVFKNLPQGTLKLGSALDSLQDEEFRERAREMLERPSDVRRYFLRERRRYESGETFEPSRFPKGTPLWIKDSLSQSLITSNKRIVENDVVDILHAVIPLRYASVVLLDGAWADFARKLKLTDLQVFSRPQLDEALEAIRTVDTSRHTIIKDRIAIKAPAT